MNHVEYTAATEARARAEFVANPPRFDTLADLSASIDLLPVITMQDFAAVVRKLLAGKPRGAALMDGDKGWFFLDGESVLFGDAVDFEYGGDLDDSAWNNGAWDGDSRIQTMRAICLPVIEEHELPAAVAA